MEQGGSFRKRSVPYAQVSTEALRSDQLSIKAKGLYAIIQSYITAPDFTLRVGHLMKMSGMGKAAFSGAWGELKEQGYLKQYRIRSAGSKSYTYEYDLLDKADRSTPATQNIGADGQVVSQGNGGKSSGNLNLPGFRCGSNSTGLKKNRVENRGGNNHTNGNQIDKNHLDSIYPSAPADGWIDEEELAELVEDELTQVGGIPHRYRDNPRHMTAAIYSLTSWDCLHPSGYSDELEQAAYDLFNEALVEMCTAADPMQLRGAHVTYAKVIDRVNAALEALPDGRLTLFSLAGVAVSDFVSAARRRDIKNQMSYMKSVIWSALLTYKVSHAADAAKL